MLEAIADLVQVLDKQHELVVQPTGALGDFPGILALAFLLPEAVDHPQGGEQGGRADNHDITVESFLEQVRLSLQGRRKRRFDGHEKQDEIQAVQAFQALVVLAGQALHMIAQRQHMLLERRLADRLVIGADVLLVGGQADLGVHHHLLVARQQDQHIRLETLAVRPFQADLGLVLAALLQPGMLKHPLENQLAPVALGLLALECPGQVGRLIAQAQVQLLQALQLLAQGEAFASFLLITFFHAFFEGLNAFLQRVEQLSEALLAVFGKPRLALVEDLRGHFGKLRTQLIP